ncbi:hypothetical protein CLAIMM_08887, partial [Cladophialophora immunda]
VSVIGRPRKADPVFSRWTIHRGQDLFGQPYQRAKSAKGMTAGISRYSSCWWSKGEYPSNVLTGGLRKPWRPPSEIDRCIQKATFPSARGLPAISRPCTSLAQTSETD